MRNTNIFRFITLIILIMHFTLTILYVMPSNPVAFCKDIGQNQANSLALMIESREVIPWSQRNAPKPRTIKTMPIGPLFNGQEHGK